VLYLGIRQELGVVFGSLAEQWECKVEEGHLMPDHVHNRFERFTPSQASGFAGGR
jgi:putative transposase